MIEVLVTMVLMAVGLLGMASLHVRLQSSEVESYQRSQALLLLSDMANRVALNRKNAASYLIAPTAPLGAGSTDALCGALPAVPTTAQRDLRDWCGALQGAAELSGADKVGAMIGGRGCVERAGSDFMITVAWQGLTPIAAPPASVGCGANSYNAASGPCVNDRCRRAVTTLVRIASL
jgi:type IV pilus assembly protein PilV